MQLECGCETHPGRFEGEGAATVILWDWSMESSHDDECGTTDAGGWFALFRGPLDGADVDRTMLVDHDFCTTHIDEAVAQLQAMAGAILWQSSQGFVSSTVYTDTQELNTAWGEIMQECEDDDPPVDDDDGIRAHL
jgi:hypothetical protein